MQVPALQAVALATAGADSLGTVDATHRQVQLVAAAAHPAALARWHAGHQREIGHVAGDHRSGANERICADDRATDDGAIGAQCGATADHGAAVLVLAHHRRARVVNIGEDRAGPDEDLILQRDRVVDRHVVLDLHAVADHHVVGDKDVLSK